MASPAHVGVVVRAAEDGGTRAAEDGGPYGVGHPRGGVAAGRVYTVEGNTSGGSTLIDNGGGVAKKSYPLTYGKIFGYGRPAYVRDKEEEKMKTQDIRKELTTVAGTGADHSPWAGAAIGTLVDAGIINGDGQGNYGWGQCLTREGAAQILYNLLERLNLLDVLRRGTDT